MTHFKLKRCLDVATEIFRLRHRNQLNTGKSCRDKENGLRHKDRLKANKLCRDRKTRLRQENMLHAEKVLSRHNILGPRHAKHPQHKSLGYNIKNEAATRKQAK